MRSFLVGKKRLLVRMTGGGVGYCGVSRSSLAHVLYDAALAGLIRSGVVPNHIQTLYPKRRDC